MTTTSVTAFSLSDDGNNLNRCDVSNDAYQMCWIFHKHNPWTSMCTKAITDYLFRNGLAVYWGARPASVTREFRDILETHWISFARDVIDQIFTRGIVPIKFVEADGTVVPIVPKGDHVIKTYVDRNQKQVFEYHRLMSKRNGLRLPTPKHDKKVIVLSGYGYDPTPQGVITSVVWSLLKGSSRTERINHLMLMNDEKNSNQRITLEMPNFLNTNDFTSGFFAAGSEIKQKASEQSQMNFYSKILEMEQNMKYNEMMSTLHGYNPKGLQSDAEKRPYHFLPPTGKLVDPPAPFISSDVGKLNEEQQITICAAYGVPISILTDTGRRAQSSVQTNVETLVRSVTNWNRILTRILTKAYQCIYLDEDCKYMLKKIPASELGKLSDEDLSALARENSVTVTFPITPHTTQGDLLTNYILGFIDMDTFRDYSLKVSGIPIQEDHFDVGKKRKKGDEKVRERLLLQMKDSPTNTFQS
jgi:hypothetical protein